MIFCENIVNIPPLKENAKTFTTKHLRTYLVMNVVGELQQFK